MKRSISPKTRKAIHNDLIENPAQMDTWIARRHNVSPNLVGRLRESLGFKPSKDYRAENIRATIDENPDASESKLAYLCRCSVDLIRKVKSSFETDSDTRDTYFHADADDLTQCD